MRVRHSAWVDLYDIGLLIAGLGTLGSAFLPRVLQSRPVSLPIIYISLGILIFALPLGFDSPNPIRHADFAERLTEMGVIVSLMGAGLKIDRLVGWARWRSTWLLLGITMPLTILMTSVLGWWAIGLSPAAAMLLGAVLAPTDPVLAADVQVDEPGEGKEDAVRFSLTSEAGLNDGLAFPFTNAAIAMAVNGAAPSGWFAEWFAIDVVYKIVGGVGIGVLVGNLLARFVFSYPAENRLAKSTEGLVALGATLIAYGVAEVANSYGFLAVFVSAIAIRNYEREHEYHKVLHDFAEESERLLMITLLALLGGAVWGGLLRPLTWQMIAVAVLLVFLVRPLAGYVALAKLDIPHHERLAISFFGIRGIGSLYYLSYGLTHADFAEAEQLWATTALVVLLSILVHGVTVTPWMDRVDRVRQTSG